MSLLSFGLAAVENGLVPDGVVRAGVRRLCEQRLRDCDRGNEIANQRWWWQFVETTRAAPIAPLSELANEQHYELPPEFFSTVLGPRCKYSCCFWPELESPQQAETTLAEAEEQALETTCQRADLADGQEILELGCGWGSLSLWMAERFPNGRITSVSNSAPQRAFIEAEIARLGLRNLKVITADMNDFAAGRQFDRIVSVEMFEHMRNLERLLGRIATWLNPDGKLFVHHFCHHRFAYSFETDGDANWMGRHFFSGGLMPSENFLRTFDRDLIVTNQWRWNGRHYQHTAEAWLRNLDANRSRVLSLLKGTYGNEAARQWLNRWRVFFIAVAELFGYANGQEWFVSHLRLEHRS